MHIWVYIVLKGFTASCKHPTTLVLRPCSPLSLSNRKRGLLRQGGRQEGWLGFQPFSSTTLSSQQAMSTFSSNLQETKRLQTEDVSLQLNLRPTPLLVPSKTFPGKWAVRLDTVNNSPAVKTRSRSPLGPLGHVKSGPAAVCDTGKLGSASAFPIHHGHLHSKNMSLPLDTGLVLPLHDQDKRERQYIDGFPAKEAPELLTLGKLGFERFTITSSICLSPSSGRRSLCFFRYPWS